jgi:aspartate-semialdehyde dehydrogenase
MNLIPYIGNVDEQGHCEEEVKIITETRRILNQPSLSVMASTVRVPVLNSHSEMVCVELEQEVTRRELMAVWENAAGVRCDEITPDAVDDHLVHIGRIRLPYGEKRSKTVMFWNVADNLRKGAATNARQILQALQTRQLI